MGGSISKPRITWEEYKTKIVAQKIPTEVCPQDMIDLIKEQNLVKIKQIIQEKSDVSNLFTFDVKDLIVVDKRNFFQETTHLPNSILAHITKEKDCITFCINLTFFIVRHLLLWRLFFLIGVHETSHTILNLENVVVDSIHCICDNSTLTHNSYRIQSAKVECSSRLKLG